MPERETADLIIEPRWLLPIAPANAVLAQHAVAVRAGRIVALGAAAALRERFPGAERVVRARHALLPGFVNAHVRASHALFGCLPARGTQEGSLAATLAATLAALERHALGADFVRDGTRLAIAQMLCAGITCFADLSSLPEESARVAAAAEVRAQIGLPVSDAASPWAQDATAHLARAAALWDAYRDHPRIGLYFAPLPALASDATLARVRRVADELDARIACDLELHPGAWPRVTPATADAAGVADAGPVPSAGAATLERLAALGLLRPGFTALGALGVPRSARELLARHGAASVACPHAELRLGALDSGAAYRAPERLALGTGSPAAAGALDVLADARLLALLGAVPATEALRLATHGGAGVLGLGAEVGSIEPGKAADLTCIDLGRAAAAPADAVADAIVFGVVRTQVSDVWCGGRPMVSAGRLLVYDPAQIESLPATWAPRLALEAAA